MNSEPKRKRSSGDPLKYASVLIREGALVLDIRSRDEFKKGHIANAIHICTADTQECGGRRMLDKLRTKVADVYPPNICIFVYCSDGGARSAAARGMLEILGYTNVTVLGGLQTPPLSAITSGGYPGLEFCQCSNV